MKNSGEETESNTKAPVSKQIQRERPQISLPDPISVGHARVVLTIEKVLPLEKDEAQGACALHPCRAMAKVVQVQGYGSSFPDPLPEGQQIEVFFPMTMAAGKEKVKVAEGATLLAEVQSPLVGAAYYIISRYEVKSQ